MSKHLSVAEAKATLSECLRDVERGASLLITRHGKPVAAWVRVEDLEHLERLQSAGPEGGLPSLAGGWEGSNELVRLIGTSRRLSRREVPTLD